MSSTAGANVSLAPPKLDSNSAQEEEMDSIPNPDALRSLSRSPHPYAFRRISSGDSITRNTTDRSASTASQSPSESSNEARSSPRNDTNGYLRPSSNRSGANGSSAALKTPSESGTEADDESCGYGFVRALPPPPTRPNKGLRPPGEYGRGGVARRSTDDVRAIASPWLTPSQLVDEDERVRNGGDYFSRPRGIKRRRRAQAQKGLDVTDEDEERRVLKERIWRKRRAELGRRLVETVLLGIISFAVIGQPNVKDALLSWWRGMRRLHLPLWIML